MKPEIKRKTPGQKESKKHAAPVGAEPDARQPPDPVLMGRFHQETRPAYKASQAAYPLRLDSPEAWKNWEAAVVHQFEVYKKYSRLLWPNEAAVSEKTPWGWDFRRDTELLRGGNATGKEAAIVFLEADPWFHGSGYDKVRLIRYLKPPMLTRSDIARLQSVVLHMVETRHGSDFSAYKRLACKVDTPELRDQLTRRLDSGDPDVRRRARWVLEALAQKDSMEK